MNKQLTQQRQPETLPGKGRKRLRQIRNDWLLYLLLLPVLAWYIIFCYVPMGGIVLAFKDFSYKGGIWGSPWVGLQNFETMLTDRYFLRAVRNTLVISGGRIVFGTICAIALAVALNELRMNRAKRTIQTIVTFPHFISWVVLSGVLINIFNSTGLFNQIVRLLGGENINLITSLQSFRPFIWATHIWKEVGWDAIIYLSAITAISPELYEAAYMDGSTRWQRIRYVTLPGIRSTIVVMFILAMGSMLTNGSFDQIFNFYSSPVYEVADTLDTYIFRETLQTGGLDYGYSTAIGLFKSIVGCICIVVTNKLATKSGEAGLM